jgi:hypothetical protein
MNYPANKDHGGNTRFLAVVGDRAVFTAPPAKPVGEVPDGLGTTILIVEVGADKAVPWTKPADFEINKFAPKEPLGKLDDFRRVGFWTLTDDTACIFLSGAANDATLLGMFTRDGGEVIDWSKVQKFGDR